MIVIFEKLLTKNTSAVSQHNALKAVEYDVAEVTVTAGLRTEAALPEPIRTITVSTRHALFR